MNRLLRLLRNRSRDPTTPRLISKFSIVARFGANSPRRW